MGSADVAVIERYVPIAHPLDLWGTFNVILFNHVKKTNKGKQCICRTKNPAGGSEITVLTDMKECAYTDLN